MAGAGRGILVGGISEGAVSGVKSLVQGNNFWTGVPKNGAGITYSKLDVDRPKLGSEFPKRDLDKLDKIISRTINENADDLVNNNIGSGDFANLRLKGFTKRNFRHNFIKLAGGVNPGSNFHAPPAILYEFADKALKLGINLNNPANAMWLHKTIRCQIHS